MLPTTPSLNPIGDIATMANFIPFQTSLPGKEKKNIWVNVDMVRWIELDGVGGTIIHFDESDKVHVESEPEAVDTQPSLAAAFARNRTSLN
jgi:hypothetical protein